MVQFHKHILMLSAGLLGSLVLSNAVAKAAAPATPFAKEVAELHAVKALLEKADHDYKGHRATAVKEITAAIHALHPGAHAKQKDGSGGNNETQKLSDDQLKEAVHKLKGMQKQLTGSQVAGAAKAATALDKAVKELEAALEIK